MVENFGICGISYVHYFHEHIANHKIVIKFVTCKLSQNKNHPKGGFYFGFRIWCENQVFYEAKVVRRNEWNEKVVTFFRGLMEEALADAQLPTKRPQKTTTQQLQLSRATP